ncbi:MAG: DnaJ domain-containing protein, partial [Bacteroidetes bacterium]|nr:DnaJ domain-containing protein [Bacteroidota bacterium]
YRKKAMLFHPDRNKDPKASEKFIEITEAYEVLINQDERELFDSYREQKSAQTNEDVFRKWREQGQRKAEEYAKCSNCGERADPNCFWNVSMYKVTQNTDNIAWRNIKYKTIVVNVPYCSKCSNKLVQELKIIEPIDIVLLTASLVLAVFISYEEIGEDSVWAFLFAFFIAFIAYKTVFSFLKKYTIFFAVAVYFYYYKDAHWFNAGLIGVLSIIIYLAFVMSVRKIFLNESIRKQEVIDPQESEKIKILLRDGWKLGDSPSTYEQPSDFRPKTNIE